MNTHSPGLTITEAIAFHALVGSEMWDYRSPTPVEVAEAVHEQSETAGDVSRARIAERLPQRSIDAIAHREMRRMVEATP